LMATDDGYLVLDAEGGVHAFGDAGMAGAPAQFGPPASPPVALVPGMGADGYLVVCADGAVMPFGFSAFHGALLTRAPGSPPVVAATAPSGRTASQPLGTSARSAR
ncbi:MAG: hypothetical protein RLN63_01945, partial [Miltoncostaeaceae bacterium]